MGWSDNLANDEAACCTTEGCDYGLLGNAVDSDGDIRIAQVWRGLDHDPLPLPLRRGSGDLQVLLRIAQRAILTVVAGDRVSAEMNRPPPQILRLALEAGLLWPYTVPGMKATKLSVSARFGEGGTHFVRQGGREDAGRLFANSADE